MMRVSWRVGSKLAREMTKPIFWSLPIFTIALPYTVATAILTATLLRFPGVALKSAARMRLATLELLFSVLA